MDKYHLICALQSHTPPDTLLPGIVRRIERVQVIHNRWKRFVGFVWLAGCVLLFMQSMFLAIDQLSQEQFMVFATALFSDMDGLVLSGANALYALLDVFPVIPFLGIFAAFGGMMIGYDAALKNMRASHT